MRRRTLVIAITTLLLTSGMAHAAFTTPACLAKKRTAWTNLRKCQGTAEAKQLLGKTADFAKCQTKFDAALAAASDKATAAGVPCRYADHGDGTVIDYDTGLQWEKKAAVVDVTGMCRRGEAHCVTDLYTWNDAQELVNGTSSDGSALTGAFAGFAGHFDWRLPSVVELAGILEVSAPGCSTSTGPCIDPVLGPTASPSLYWSGTSDPSGPLGDEAWYVLFDNGLLGPGRFTGVNPKFDPGYVRAVRSAL
jgi:hypothetical protein